MLARVRGEFVHGHCEGECGGGRQNHVCGAAGKVHTGGIQGQRVQGRPDHRVEGGALPVLAREQIVGVGQGDQPRLERRREEGRSAAPRAVWAAIDCTTARVFFTR